MKRKPFLLLAGLRFPMGFAFASAPLISQADILYWDTNGATPGSTSNSSGGGQNGWGPHNVWSTSEAGDLPTIGYIEDSDVVFSAGTNATGGPIIIRINGARRANSLTFEEGTITLSSGNANGDFVSGAGSLSLGAGGITITDSVNGITTIAGGLGTLTLTANQTWNNLSVTTPQALRVETAVAGTATAGNTMTLTLTGTGPSTVANLLVGSITNGSAGGELALTKSGSSVYSFIDSAANTYTGLTTVTGGLLLLNKTAGVTSIAGNISVTGGTLEWRQHNQIADSSSITITGGRVNFFDRAETLDSINLSAGALDTGSQGTSSQITITNALTQSGGKTTINSGGNLYAGSIVMTGTRNIINGTGGGNILIGGNNASVKSALTVGSGGLSMSGQDIQFNLTTGAGIGSRIVLEGDFTGSGTNNIGYGTGGGGKLSSIELGTAERTFEITGGTTTIGVTIAGTGATLTKTGAGILAFSDANTYTGVTQVNAGSLHVLHSEALGGSAAGTVVASGASVTLNNSVTVEDETLHLTGASFDAPQNAGLVNAGGDNVWTGDITANNSNGQQVRLNNAAGTLDIQGNVFIDSASGATGIGLVLTGAGGTGTISGNISGTGNNQNLIKTGNGTWILTGTNSYTGTTRVDAGIVSVASIATNLGSANTQISLGDGSGSGRLRYTGTGETVSRGFVLRSDSGGGGIIEHDGTGLLKINGNITSNNSTSAKTITLTGSSSGTGEIAGNILNSGNSATNIAKSGSGTWRLSGAGNTFTGSITVTEGTLIAATSLNTSTSLSVTNGTFSFETGNVINDNAQVTLGAEAILQFNGFSDVLGVLAVTGNAVLALSGGNSMIVFADSTSGDWSGGNLTISGWSGLASGGGAERVSFANHGLTDEQRGKVYFSDPEGFAPGLYSAVFVGNELVPGELIPEPSAIFLSGAAFTSFALRRKRSARNSPAKESTEFGR